MADAQQVIELVFNGIDKTAAATQSALNNLGSFANSAQTITQPVADFTAAAVKLEAGILAAGVAMVAFSIKTAGDFDTAFRQISTLFTASEEDMAGFKDAILSYSSTSSQSLEAITNSISAAIGSGVSWSDSLALISTAEQLAVATRADLKSTTEVLVSTMNVYGIATTDAGRVSDLFFQTIKDGKIEMNDLAGSLSMVSPVAQAAGVSLEEMLAAIAILTASGIPASTSMEYLRGTISGIMAPSSQASSLAQELGLSFGEQALKANGLAGVLAEMNDKTGGSSEKMKILLGDMGGTVAAMVLAKDGAKELKEGLVSMGDATGSVGEAFKKMQGSIDVSTALVSNSLNALFVSIGAPLLDEFGGIANAIAAIFNALGASVKEGSLGTLVEYVEGLMGDLQATLETVAGNLPAALAGADFSGFKNGIDVVVQSVKNLFGNIDLSTVDGLTAAIELAGAAFLGLSSYVSGVIDSFKPLFDQLVAVGGGLADVDSNIFKTAGEMAGFVTQANLLAGGLNTLIPALDALVGLLILKQGVGLAGAMGLTAEAAAGLAVKLGQVGLVGAAGAAGYAVGTVLNDGISAVLTKMTGSETTLGSWIYDLTHGGDAATEMGAKTNAATGGIDKLGQAVGDAGKAVGGVVEPLGAATLAMLVNSNAAEESAGYAAKFGNAQKTATNYVLEMVPIINKATGEITGYREELVKSEGTTAKLSTASKNAGTDIAKIADETKKAEDATRKWNEEVAKMNFQEKLKLIESQTKIMTAQIEADAKKAVAAFESIGTTITSTGDVLGELFGTMKDFGSMDWEAIRLIKEQINKENDLRQKAFDLQKELTQAQIAQMKAQTDALMKGDGLIKIDGAGLKPHLEAFMWEILRAIQVKVNKDGLKMLLGA